VSPPAGNGYGLIPSFWSLFFLELRVRLELAIVLHVRETRRPLQHVPGLLIAVTAVRLQRKTLGVEAS